VYKKALGPLLAAAGISMLLTACGAFGAESTSPTEDAGASEGGPPPEGGSGDAAIGDGSATDAALADGAILPAKSVACGSAECDLGKGCCLSSKSPVCTKQSECAGFFVACATTADCGSAGVCCFDGVRASCAATCGALDRPTCNVGTDCMPGSCASLACASGASPPTSPFHVCSDGAPTTYLRDGMTCSVP
jgi:hypothetical protein